MYSMNKYPYICKINNSGIEFTPTRVDYENQRVWHQKGQASENGEWYDFDEVTFKDNPDFKPLT